MIEEILKQLNSFTIKDKFGNKRVLKFDQQVYQKYNYLFLQEISTINGTMIVLGESVGEVSYNGEPCEGHLILMSTAGEFEIFQKMGVADWVQPQYEYPDLLTEQICNKFSLIPLAVYNHLYSHFTKSQIPNIEILIEEQTKTYLGKIKNQEHNSNNNNNNISNHVSFRLQPGEDEFLVYKENANKYEVLFKAAERGYPEAITQLTDISRTATWGQPAYVLGRIYLMGQVVDKNLDLAEKYLRHAVGCQYFEAQYYLALALIEPGNGSQHEAITLLIAFAHNTSDKNLFAEAINVLEKIMSDKISLIIEKAHIYSTSRHVDSQKAGDLIQNISELSNLNQEQIDKLIIVFDNVCESYNFSDTFLLKIMSYFKQQSYEGLFNFNFVKKLLKQQNSELKILMLMIPAFRDVFFFYDKNFELILPLLSEIFAKIPQHEQGSIVADLINGYSRYTNPSKILDWLKMQPNLVREMVRDSSVHNKIKDNKHWQEFLKENKSTHTSSFFNYIPGFGTELQNLISQFQNAKIDEPEGTNNNNNDGKDDEVGFDTTSQGMDMR